MAGFRHCHANVTLLSRPQLLLGPGLAQPVARRLTVRQDLFEREPVHPGLPENFRLIVSVSMWLVGCFRKPANMGTISWSSDTGKNEDCRQLAGLVTTKRQPGAGVVQW